MKKDKQSDMRMDLTSGSVSRTLTSFAAPMVLANLLQTVYNLVSMAVMGQFVGKEGLSAVSIGSEILQTLTFLVMGFCSGGQIIIAQFVGAKDKESVKKTIGTVFTVILCSSVIFTIASITGINTILRLLNTPAEAFEMARTYCLTCFSGLFFIYGYNTVSAVLRGMGDSRHPLIFIAIAAVINLLLNLLFVIVFKWGALGAALATVIGQAISFITSIIFLYRRREAFGFDFKRESFKIDRFIFKKLMRLGIPMCLQSAAINFSVMFVSSYINAYGVVASAVTGIGTKLGNVTSVVCNSLSTAGSGMIGQSLGAGKIERVPKVIRFSLIVNLAFASILTVLTILIPRQIFGLFNSDQEVLNLAMTYVTIAVMNYYGIALRSPSFALINGVGMAKLNLTVGLLDGVVCRIGLALLMGITAGMGINGFWYGNVLAGYIPFLIGGTYYLTGRWRTQKLLISR